MLYRLVISLLYLVALLPLRALYLVSDLVAFVLNKVIRYRVDIVRQNLHSAFPEKTEEELRKIEKRFYVYLCDTFVETVKLLHISDRQLKKRVVLHNTDLVAALAREKKPIILFLGHYANWEWVPALTLSIHEPKTMGALYRPLSSKTMDRVMLKIRSRFGSECIPVNSAYRYLIEMKRRVPSFMIGFIGDQRPVGIQPKHWTMFLNRPTGFVAGGETIGDRVGAAYVYADMRRVRRGYYTLTFRPIEVEGEEKDFPFTRGFFRLLEQSINEAPPYWLWSHNRWKSKPTPEDLKNM